MRHCHAFLLAWDGAASGPADNRRPTAAPAQNRCLRRPAALGALARIGTVKFRSNNATVARLSPDGKLLAVAGPRGEIEVWDVPAWKNRKVLRMPEPKSAKDVAISALFFSPASKILPPTITTISGSSSSTWRRVSASSPVRCPSSPKWTVCDW